MKIRAFKRLFGRKKRGKGPSSSQCKSQSDEPQSKPTPFLDEDLADMAYHKEQQDSPKRITTRKKEETTSEKPFYVGGGRKEENPNVQIAPQKALDERRHLSNPTATRNSTFTSTKSISIEPPGKRGSNLSEKSQSDTVNDLSSTAAKTGGKDNKKLISQGQGNGVSPCQVDEVIFPESDVDYRHSTISRAYDSIPLLEQTKLPRGGISIETEAVGRVQFGIPPETIKDSMRLGIPVPQIYIVPVERFCRDLGPALGVNLAEFEFPAYFNFFVRQKTCTLLVDSQEAEDNIRLVFEETLLGPKKFRRGVDSVAFDEHDFDPEYPEERIPNLEKELRHFRSTPDGGELSVDLMLKFCHFVQPDDGFCHKNLGVPPNLDAINDDEVHELVQQDYDEAIDEFEHVEREESEQTTVPFQGKEVPKDEREIRAMEKTKSKWSYGRARWVGDVATIWSSSATDEEKKNRSVPRVEIFKMPSGTEYIIHDIDENNIVIGKARFSGNMKVNETMGLEGFGDSSVLDFVEDEDDSNRESRSLIPRSPPSFYPPSFGVTILGNSHGFDPSGSVSGYVLWINGRGLMIDPPPYASAALEREGIRPRTIVGIIITHTHSDHDAGAFQKVLTGSPVVVITTPTIYKSFIRKYAALSSLNPALLRHCHRYKPAIIGQDLRFQGATFKFFYSLHSIPCVGFRVEWRGRSIVFSGDHLHDPVILRNLQEKGVLSRGRADELLNRPFQNTDLLLHEAGVPPIHTSLSTLNNFPKHVKKRMYVVHTAKIPDEFNLRKAPTGTAGTLRLDESHRGSNDMTRCGVSMFVNESANKKRNAVLRFEDDEVSFDSGGDEYVDNEESRDQITSQAAIGASHRFGRASSIVISGRKSSIPLVSLRTASNTDSWYMLNLLQAVPFLTSLPYTSTMEVLESARVEAVNKNDIVVPSICRNDLLCVVWEGTCVERKARSNLVVIEDDELFFQTDSNPFAVWHSGDWTGPIALQPEKRLSGASDKAKTHDIVATSKEGVKMIILEFKSLHRILKNGSPLYRKYLERQKSFTSNFEGPVPDNITPRTEKLFKESSKKLNILDLIDMNTALRKLSAVQKRHLECIAEGPVAFNPGERLWRAGAPVDKAFLVVAGTAAFVIRRRNSAHPLALEHSGMLDNFDGMMKSKKSETESGTDEEVFQGDRDQKKPDSDSDDDIHLESLFGRSKKHSSGRPTGLSDRDDFDKLSKTLLRRAESLGRDDNISVSSSHDEFSQSSEGNQSSEMSDDRDRDRDRRSSLTRRRSSRARFVNKALVRLYDRRAFTGGLVFSRGHFLGDVSKMVAGFLASGDSSVAGEISMKGEDSIPSYGFGEKKTSKKSKNVRISNMVIHEKDGEGRVMHTSTLTAEHEGCIVLVFPRESLTRFLDAHPGLLLSLLGTQVIV